MWLAKCPLPTPVSPVIKIVQCRCAARSASCSHKGAWVESLDSLEGDLGLPKPGAGGLLAMSFSLFPPLSADGTTIKISISIEHATCRERGFQAHLPTPRNWDVSLMASRHEDEISCQNERWVFSLLPRRGCRANIDPGLFSGTNVTRSSLDASVAL